MRGTVWLAAFAYILCSAAPGFGQVVLMNGIQGTGSKVLEQPAERMRMQIDLLAKSKDLQDALKKLTARKTKVAKQLETLGALKDTVKFGEPRIVEPTLEQQPQFIAMRQQMMRRPGKKPPVEQALPLKVALHLTAEWPLKGSDGGARLLEARTLQDAIKDADLAGRKEAEELSPEEEELAEEADDELQMQMGLPGQMSRKPGDPVFAFTARIVDADREKGLAEACREARTEAAQLARAGGIELGSLRSLQSMSMLYVEGIDGDQPDNIPDFSPPDGRLAGITKSEVIGFSPGVLKYKISVIVAFDVAGK